MPTTTDDSAPFAIGCDPAQWMWQVDLARIARRREFEGLCIDSEPARPARAAATARPERAMLRRPVRSAYVAIDVPGTALQSPSSSRPRTRSSGRARP